HLTTPYKVVFATGATAPADCSGTALYSGTNTTYTHTGRTNGTQYSYRVCAIDNVSNMSSGGTGSATPASVDSLVGYWNLNETSGNAADSSGNGNTGILYGSPVWTTSGKMGGALNFDGTDGYVNVGNGTSLNITSGITIAAWVKISSETDEHFILKKGDTSGQYSYFFYQNGTQLRFAISTNGTTEQAVNTDNGFFVNGSWVHAVVTYNGSTWAAYKNGQSFTKYGTVTGNMYSSTSPVIIGPGANGLWSEAVLDDVRVYNYALTAGEITTLYNNSSPTAGTITLTPSTATYVPGTVTTMSAPFTSVPSITGCEYTLGASWEPATLSGSSPNYTCTQSGISGFTDGTAYTVNMRATNSYGTTTATALSRTGDTTAPTNPTLTATPGDGHVDLSWTTPTDSKSGLHSTAPYKLVFATGGTSPANCNTGTVISTTTATTATHSSLNNGTQYSYRICSIDTLSNMSSGGTASATPVGNVNAMVGYWNLNETSGSTATDSSGNGNTGTLYGDSTWNTAGKIGGALTLDGTGDYVLAGNNSSLNLTTAATLSAWIKFNSGSQDWCTIVGKGFETTANYGFEGYSNWIRLESGNGSSYSSGIEKYYTTVGEWVHVVGVFTTIGSTTQLDMYINGSFYVTDTVAWPLTTSAANFGMGRSDYATSFNGLVDDVRVYNYALTAGEITTLYNNAPPTVGTITLTPSTATYVPGTVTTMSAPFTSVLTITGCEYNLGASWSSATLSGSSPNYICTQSAITGFTDGTAYTVNMRATNSYGTTIATGLTRTGDTVAPTNPTLTATAGNGYVDLSWTTPTDSRSGLHPTAPYKVVYATGVTAPANCSTGNAIYTTGTGTTFHHASLTNGTQYSYRICSIDAVSNMSAGGTASATPVGQSLVGYWNLNETSGSTATDSSGNGNTGNLEAQAAWTTGGRIDGGISLDGVDDRINVPYNSSLDLSSKDWTISFWAYPTSLGTSDQYFIDNVENGIAGHESFYIAKGGGNLQVLVFLYNETNTQISANTDTELTLNDWNLVTVTFVNEVAHVYVNGTERTLYANSFTGYMPVVPYDIHIGGRGTHYFPGVLDDVRIYNYALSAADILALYNSAPALVPATPVNLYAEANSTGIALSWYSASDPTITNYKIYRGTSSGNESLLATIGQGGTIYNDAKTPHNTLYYYKVTAVNSYGESAYSNEVSATSPNFKYIFASATATYGSLGGYTGANTKCNTYAANAGLPGTYKAWISDAAGITAATNISTHAQVPYKKVNGTVVANNWTDLTDGTLTSAINMSETGGTPATTAVWTNTLTTGERQSTGSYSCSTVWSRSTSSYNGNKGLNTSTSSTWTSNSYAKCNTNAVLYCVEN
ncbi:MAG: LamG-like jellyroll fold domain-containing protein, partial [Minisyncoccia bacterium]